MGGGPQDSLIRCPIYYRTTKRRSWKGETPPVVRSEPNVSGQLTIRIHTNGQTRNTCKTRALFRDKVLKGALILDTTFRSSSATNAITSPKCSQTTQDSTNAATTQDMHSRSKWESNPRLQCSGTANKCVSVDVKLSLSTP